MSEYYYQWLAWMGISVVLTLLNVGIMGVYLAKNEELFQSEQKVKRLLWEKKMEKEWGDPMYSKSLEEVECELSQECESKGEPFSVLFAEPKEDGLIPSLVFRCGETKTEMWTQKQVDDYKRRCERRHGKS